MTSPIRLTIIVLCALIFLSIGLPVQSYERTALLIGNSQYAQSPLKNPANDANDLAAALQKLDFSVTLKKNVTLEEMKKAIQAFGRKLRNSRIGVFYYAGHAMQIKGRNYLLPVDCTIESESDVEFEGVDAARILGKMEDAGNEVNVVILDACRNNPFARSFRSYGLGLARMDAPRGTLIAYATAPGEVARDGDGRNGVFTKYLLQNMKKPGLTVEKILKNVRVSVLQHTRNTQVPWTSSSMTGELIFNTGENWQGEEVPLRSLQTTTKKFDFAIQPHKIGLSGQYLAIGGSQESYQYLYNLSSGDLENDKLAYYSFLDSTRKTSEDYSINLYSRAQAHNVVEIRHLGQLQKRLKIDLRQFGKITQLTFTDQGAVLLGTDKGYLLFYSRAGHLLYKLQIRNSAVRGITVQNDTIAVCHKNGAIVVLQDFERDRTRASALILEQ